LTIKPKVGHFDTVEVIKAELQAVLPQYTKYGFQDEFKNSRRTWNGAHARKGTTSKVMMASRPKVNI
jgi:hypothetical protein